MIGDLDRWSTLMAAVLLWIVALVIIVSLLGVADRGFDITDEAYYTQSILKPRDIWPSPVDFGPYFSLLGDDIVFVRRVSILLMVSAGALLGFAVARVATSSLPGLLAVTAVGGLGGLTGIAKWWLLTPSYNTLSLIGTTIIAAGVLIYASGGIFKRNWWNIATAVLVGLGIALAFSGRPNAAVALTIVTLPAGFIFAGWRQGVLLTGITAVTTASILLTQSLLLDGSPSAYVERLYQARDLALILSPAYSQAVLFGDLFSGLQTVATRLAEPPFSHAALGLAVWVGVLTLIARLMPRFRWISAFLLALGFFGASAYAFLNWHLAYPNSWLLFMGEWILEMTVIFIGVALVSLIFWPFTNPATRKSQTYLIIAALYLVLIGAFLPFGSNNIWTRSIGSSGLFFALAVFLLAKAAAPGTPMVLSLATLVLVLSPVGMAARDSVETPYRLVGGLQDQTENMDFLGNPTKLRVDPKTAIWASELQMIAQAAGWQPGTPLLDLTGGTPGAAVVLGAHAPSVPWLIGGYSGSAEFVTIALSFAPSQVIATAWLLTAPEGSRALSKTVTSDLGLNFPTDYVRVGEVTSGWRSETQVLWRPITN